MASSQDALKTLYIDLGKNASLVVGALRVDAADAAAVKRSRRPQAA